MELDLVLRALKSEYGYDLSHYSKGSLLRRLNDVRLLFELEHLSDIVSLILWSDSVRDLVMSQLTVNVTEMFRDPDFFICFRDKVLPKLKTFPYSKIWHAGCSTGEEVYSTAMLLRDTALLDTSIIYGTDISRPALEKARAGIYAKDVFHQCEQRSRDILQESVLTDHYHALYSFGRMDKCFLPYVTFSHHDLAQDGAFGEMNIIFCRNVLIYFDKELQNRVLDLFMESLRPGGYLCLGEGESLYFSISGEQFQPVDLEQRIYQKKISP